MDVARLAAAIEEERERFEVPGLAVAVTRGDEVVLSATLGSRDLAAGLPVTESTVFAIGSTTKSFTSALAGLLVEDGVLTWDEPIRRHVPGLRLQDPVASELLSLRDMLAHRSGLPRHDLVWYGNETLTREGAVDALRHLAPDRQLRESWQYNNLLYLAAGHVCGQLLGVSWEDAVQKRLLDPLGLRSTAFSAAAALAALEVATPYMRLGGSVEPVAFRDIGVCGPAGSMNATLADMARWAMLHANLGTVGGVPVLRSSTVGELLRPSMVRPGDPSSPEVVSAGYGLGWFLETYRGRSIAHCGGNIDGFSSMVAVLPEQQLGVVVLANLHVTGAVNAIPFMVFDHLLGTEDAGWGPRLHRMYAQVLDAAQQAQQRPPGAVAPTPPSHPLADYVATYAHPAYGELTASADGDALTVGFHALDWSTTHRTHDTWDLRSERMGITVPATFRTDADGQVTEVAVPFEPAVPAIVFTRVRATTVDAALAHALSGAYAAGEMTVEVGVDAKGGLFLAVTGGPTQSLSPRDGLSFTIDAMPHVAVEFRVDDDGRGSELVAGPFGLFTRVDDAG